MGHRTALSSCSSLVFSSILSTIKHQKLLITPKRTTVVTFHCIALLLLITMQLNTVHCSLLPQKNLIKCHTTNITKTLCILDSKQEELTFSAENVPDRLEELKIIGGKHVYLSKELFSKTKILKLIHIENNSKVVISSGIFNHQNRYGVINVKIINNNFVQFESDSLKTSNNLFIKLNIINADRVIIRPDTFYELDSVNIYNVTSLELQENSFKLSAPKTSTPTATVLFDNVTLKELPKGAFPSALDILTLRNCKIGYVSADSIRLIELRTFTIDNCSMDVWGNGAFSSRTLVLQLHISNSRLKTVQTDAFSLGGGGLLTIRNSTIKNIYSGAFNMTVATVVFINNTFENIRNMGFTLTKDTSWRHMELENNTFKMLDANAFNAPYIPNDGDMKKDVFIFRRNYINNAAVNTFNLSVPNDINITVSDNYFGDVCHCNLSVTIKKLFSDTSEDIKQTLFETSKCKITKTISRCFNLPQGFMLMRNFTDSVCDLLSPECADIVYDDEDSQETGRTDMLPFIPPFNGEMMKERKVLQVIIVIALFFVFVILLTTLIMWLHRNEYFTKGRILLFLSTESLFNLICRLCVRSSGISRSNSAHSISRISVHEYAELHGQKIQEIEEEILPSEDKGTQTLPEELTQELLQSLREKLDDPENYSEARDMIEHLYDLIKVEESCNKNYPNETTINFDEFDDNAINEQHVYDEIKPNKTNSNKRTPRSKKVLVTVGTRAPSPEKLLPAKVGYGEARRKSLMLGEYSEPKDKQDQTAHEYSELPQGKSPAIASTRSEFFAEYFKNPISPTKTDNKINLNNTPMFLLANRPLPEKPDPGEGPSTSST